MAPPYLLVRLATDLLGEERTLVRSSRRLGDPAELEELPSSPDPELELLLLLLVYMREESWEPLGEGGKPKQGWDSDCRLLLEFSLYMDTGLVRFGEPPQEPMYEMTPPGVGKEEEERERETQTH